ncbi:hypothetical protein PUNSTDRAFT_125843 [Punctularia strigosozonata HHB-11173 SS5]|uniref:uncharacterized protein n=1 Tax=Punctularia strigosozonata (strain HHB-11173) TaxID=741275 RepID=UPI00044181ED|nr:uncharacterized protein PUNSTDRAFT_125843 [Punctularia strigosozonata HHB-11173 SS5]EIN09799.1 hypothetical protein PUNSTDRAFT_125843 [Punctularia strigosozonata HHB-11173 SS5]
MDDNVLDRNSVRRMQALKLVGGERFYRMRTEQSTIHALHAILQACKNVETLCIPYLRNTSPTPRPAEGLPRNLVRLRRLTVYRWRWDGNSTFMPSDHGLTSISTTTVLDLNRQSLEELNLDHALVNFSLPAFPALRILRLTHTMIVGLDLLKEALSSKSQGGLEVIEFRNHWGSLSFSSPLEICGAIIQPNTRTLKELVLVGLDEMKLARTLDFEAFKVLHRLSIGYLARDEDPFEIVKVPHRVRVLDVHWEEMVESASRRVAYFFRTLELMEMYIVRDAYIQTSRQDGAQLSVQVVGQAPPRLRRLCSDWNIPVLEDEPEEFKGSDIGLRKDATLPQGPMHTLRVTFPSEMKIPWVEVG